MRLMLKGFSQEAELENPSDIKYMLIFIDMDSGGESKLPVLKETTEALIKWLYPNLDEGNEAVQKEVFAQQEEIEEFPLEEEESSEEKDILVDDEGVLSI